MAPKSTLTTDIRVLGQWSGGLSNSGEPITLVDAAGVEIAEIEYGDSDPWAFAADGNGASLELIDPVGTTSDLWDKPYSWRASAQVGGTPGAASTPASGILINEILAHTDVPESDSIELFNPTDSDIDISGWYLSDSGDEPQKYQIPAGTVLEAGDYLSFQRRRFQSHVDFVHRNPVRTECRRRGSGLLDRSHGRRQQLAS